MPGGDDNDSNVCSSSSSRSDSSDNDDYDDDDEEEDDTTTYDNDIERHTTKYFLVCLARTMRVSTNSSLVQAEFNLHTHMTKDQQESHLQYIKRSVTTGHLTYFWQSWNHMDC